MRLRMRVVLGVLMALAAPVAARPDGAWTTYVRPTGYTALDVEADTVLVATSDAGLLRFTPSTRSFEFILREPNGLASNQLLALATDASRRVWAGTRGAGVSVWSADRAHWTLVNTFDGLPTDTVNTLTAAGDSMWIGTTAGIGVWDGTQLSGRVPDGINPSPFASDFITGILPLGDSVWVGTHAGVYVARRSTGLPAWTLVNTGLPSTFVQRIVDDGSVPFALAGLAVRRWNPVTLQWVSTGGIGGVSTLVSRNGSLIAASDQGLYRWTGSNWVQITPTIRSGTANPLAVTLDDDGRFWAAGQSLLGVDGSDIGLYHDTGSGVQFDFPPGPSGNNCLNLELDRDRVYVTTYDQGLARLRDGEWTCWFPHAAPSTDPTQFRQPVFNFALLADPLGYKWVYSWAGCSGTSTGTLDILDDSGTIDDVRHVVLGPDPALARRSYARASTLDGQGGHWFGMDSPCEGSSELAPAGLEYYRPDTTYGGNFTRTSGTNGVLISNQIWSLVTDRDGRVWVGAGKGLSYFDPPNPSTMHLIPNTDNDLIRALATKRDSLWVLTTTELRRYSLPAGIFQGSYTLPGSPTILALRPMDVGIDGTLWLGTATGVRAYHPGGAADDFTTANSPLVNNDVHTIRVERSTGVVWMATGGGISRFDPYFVPAGSSEGGLSFHVYPNPARLSAVLRIQLTGSGSSYDGAVYDLNGRRVRRFRSPVNGGVVWDGRDENGTLVRPGIYFVRAQSSGREAVQRIVLLR